MNLSRVKQHISMVIVWIVWALIVTLTITAVVFGVSFARAVKDCQRQFNSALVARSDLADQRNTLNVRKDEADTAWLDALVTPPADIAALPQTDPKRRAYNLEVTKHYQDILLTIKDERAANDIARARNPLPHADCG